MSAPSSRGPASASGSRPSEWRCFICASARARSSILSGRYPYHLGLYNNNEGDFPLSYALLPALLKQPPPPGAPRWATHALGKWHLGWAFLNYTATFRGFDTFFGSSGNTADYWAHTIHGPSYSCDGAGPGTWRDFIDARGNKVALAPVSRTVLGDGCGSSRRCLLCCRSRRSVSSTARC